MMRILTAFLLLVVVRMVFAGIPFVGPGVNTHGQYLPVKDLRAIGIRWVRADVPVAELSQSRVREIVLYWRSAKMPVLFILPQTVTDAPAMAKNLVHWGVTDIEVGNETDGPWFNLSGVSWSGWEYGRWFKPVKLAVKGYARCYGPVTTTWKSQYVRDAISGGMKADAISFHGYLLPNMATAADSASKSLRLPVVISEVGVNPGEDAAAKFVAWQKLMGSRPWCWYDGPATDWRGLFDWTSGYRWDKPTDLYGEILKLQSNERGSCQVMLDN